MEEFAVAGNNSNNKKRPRGALAGNNGASSPATAAAAAWRTSRVARAAAGGKDRHSKVVTSRGLRDRRVRLSVPTAIAFYDIQDRLGVDQPSKAIDWLIRAAASAIDSLPSLDCSSFLLPSPPATAAAAADADGDNDVTSETSKSSSVLSLAAGNGNGNGNENVEQQQQQQQATMAYYAAAAHMAAPMAFEMTPAMPHHHLAFSQEQNATVTFERGTLQSNAVAAASLWPLPASASAAAAVMSQHQQYPFLLQRFAAAPAEVAGLPFFLAGGGGGAAGAPVTANVGERRLQLWDFKEERKS